MPVEPVGEELLTNGGMAGTAGWTVPSSGLTVNGCLATLDRNGGNQNAMTQSVDTVFGGVYAFGGFVESISHGFKILVSGNSQAMSVGWNYFEFTSGTGGSKTYTIQLSGNVNATAVFTNLFMKHIG